MQLEETFKKVKRASKSLALLSDQQRNEMLLAVADAIIDQPTPQTWRRWMRRIRSTTVCN